MSAWRRTALRLFPERKTEITACLSIYDLLGRLEHDLRAVYAGHRPDEGLTDRIFAFAELLSDEKQDDSVQNAVAVGFYEHLPNCEPGRRDMARRLAVSRLSKLEPLFRQMLEASDYEAFMSEIERVHGQRLSPAT